MRIISITVYSWENGKLQISLESGDSVNITMTDDESERVRQLGTDIFFARQKSIAREIETARPQLIELKPTPIEEPAEYEPPTVQPSSDFDDDVPF